MLCTLIEEPFDDPAWFFEPKLDGLRLLSYFDGRQVRMLSRTGKPQNAYFPEIDAALRECLARPAIVDGEVVCLDDQGQPRFHAIQPRFHVGAAREVELRMGTNPAYVYLFDAIYVDRYRIDAAPLLERKELLHDLVAWNDRVRWTDYHSEHGIALWREACASGGEGIVGKKADSAYVQGRSLSWVKIKCLARQEFVIGGFTEPQRSRLGFGALLIGYYDEDGKTLRYAGKVGAGFSDQTLNEMRRRLQRIEQPRSPFHEPVPSAGYVVHWVRPALVAEVAFGEWSPHGRLRHPRFEGLRPDKRPGECRRERPQ